VTPATVEVATAAAPVARRPVFQMPRPVWVEAVVEAVVRVTVMAGSLV
jgi:hypothetical protein